jgi:hypothetical protein
MFVVDGFGSHELACHHRHIGALNEIEAPPGGLGQ